MRFSGVSTVEITSLAPIFFSPLHFMFLHIKLILEDYVLKKMVSIYPTSE